jgi:sulfur carrier protein
VIVVVNGSERELEGEATIVDVLRLLGAEQDQRGVAVALDGVVVPRGRWPQTPLHDGDRVEVVAAIQGG